LSDTLNMNLKEIFTYSNWNGDDPDCLVLEASDATRGREAAEELESLLESKRLNFLS